MRDPRRELIWNWMIRNGNKEIPIKTVCEEFGMKRTSILKFFTHLENEHVLERINYGHWKLVPYTPKYETEK